jgi:crotonobetainyl-CoA:carnitine CoA-transferase CaiB-like acyl-CoA transferase
VSASEPSARPLAGVRVLDLTRVLAGPYVGRMLADLGADVVKVEPPEGDVTRKWGKQIAGLSGYYTQQNVGKRNVCIDTRAAGGAELIARLAEQADVLIENFRPGVMDKLGLSYATLSARNPKLVMLSVSGFGQEGPEAKRPAYAAVIHAESGVMQRQAAIDGTRPVDPRISIADMNAALHGLIGLLSALVMRQRTGSGQHIDISMLETMISTDDYMHLALDGLGAREGVIVNQTWDVVGGQIVIAGDFRWVWKRLQETFELKDPAAGDAPIPVKARLRQQAAAEFFKSFTERDALIAALKRADLPYGAVMESREALASPTLEARGAIARVDDRAGGLRNVIRSPYRFSNAQSGVAGPAPYRGEHNRAVLGEWLELLAPELETLEQAQVLLAESPPAAKR